MVKLSINRALWLFGVVQIVSILGFAALSIIGPNVWMLGFAVVFEYLGVNTLHGPTAPEPSSDLNEVGLRVAAHCDTREEAEVVRREILHLWTLGGVGSAIMPPGRPRPVTSLWPTLIPRDAVEVDVRVLEA